MIRKQRPPPPLPPQMAKPTGFYIRWNKEELVGKYLVAQLVKNLPEMQETLVQFLGWEDPLEKEMVTPHTRVGHYLATKPPTKLRGKVKKKIRIILTGLFIQDSLSFDSVLKNVSFSWYREGILHTGDFTSCFEEEMGRWEVFLASVIVSNSRWAIGKEPACQCCRPKRCGFDPWVGKILWRRTWQPTPVFLPAESHGQRNLAGYSPWGSRVRHDWSDPAAVAAFVQVPLVQNNPYVKAYFGVA